MRFQALTLLVKGYALAGVIGIGLALGGADELTAILAIWLGGAVLTLAIGATDAAGAARPVPVRAKVRGRRRESLPR